jgi:cytochrome c oxidase assembly protein subunit 23
MSQFYDPCQDFADRSIKCLHRNHGDRAMCQDYFECVYWALQFRALNANNATYSAYKECKKQWVRRPVATLSSHLV